MLRIKHAIIVLGFFLLVGCNKPKPSLELEIVSTSNIHGYALTPNEERIGYAMIANYVEFLKETNEYVLLMDAGDYIQGNALTNFTKGASVVKVMNAVGYDIATIGKHEFDFGWLDLLQRKNEATFSMVSANIRRADYMPFLEYQSFNFDGLKVAVVGITTPETLKKTASANVEGLEFLDPVTVLKPLVSKLKKDHDVIILLSHLGSEGQTSIDSVVEHIDGIDVIIDGHDHVTTPFGSKIHNTFIMNAGAYASGLGHTIISIEEGKVVGVRGMVLGADAEELQAEYTMRPGAMRVQELLAEITTETAQLFKRVVANIPYSLEGEREVVRTKETNLGRLIADSFRHEAESDFAFMNGGGIRTSLQAGDVTLEQLISVLPYDNSVVKIEITGKDLRDALEHGLSAYPEASASFPHIAGFTYSYDLSAPVGQRVIDIWVEDQLLDESAIYSLALLTFLSTGGDGYHMFERDIIGEFSSDTDIVVRYIASKEEDAFTNIQEERSWSVQNKK